MSHSTICRIYASRQLPLPEPLQDWDDRVADWCDDYRDLEPQATFSEIVLAHGVFVFDHFAERVVCAYAISVAAGSPRDASRIRGFPDAAEEVALVSPDEALQTDRGHYLSHATGGGLDINLFPHRRELNRGWSEEGKLFREMERFAAGLPGTFHFHRPIYDDAGSIPATLEYGILKQDGSWWVSRFKNK